MTVRIIDADALKQQFEIWDEDDEVAVWSIMNEIDSAPTIKPERNVGTCDECIHEYRFDYEPPCKMCIRIASKGRDGDYFCKDGDTE